MRIRIKTFILLYYIISWASNWVKTANVAPNRSFRFDLEMMVLRWSCDLSSDLLSSDNEIINHRITENLNNLIKFWPSDKTDTHSVFVAWRPFTVHVQIIFIKVIYLQLVPRDVRLTDAVEQKPSDIFLLNSATEFVSFQTSNALKILSRM